MGTTEPVDRLMTVVGGMSMLHFVLVGLDNYQAASTVCILVLRTQSTWVPGAHNGNDDTVAAHDRSYFAFATLSFARSISE